MAKEKNKTFMPEQDECRLNDQTGRLCFDRHLPGRNVKKIEREFVDLLHSVININDR